MHIHHDNSSPYHTLLSVDSLQFTYKSKTIQSDDTPSSIGMDKDDDANPTIQVSLTGVELTKENIVQACKLGSITTSLDLLSQNKEFCSAKLTWFDSDGQELSTPPMFICIDYGHSELVEKLLPLHSGDVLSTLKDGDGDYSPLQWASWTGRLDIVKILVEKGGAAVDEEALSLARENNHNDVAEYLLQHVDLYSGLEGDDEIMEKACREGDLAMVKKLLEEENYSIDKWKDGEFALSY